MSVNKNDIIIITIPHKENKKMNMKNNNEI